MEIFHLSNKLLRKEKCEETKMAVLLSYHKLVERDAKHVDIYWKGEINKAFNEAVLFILFCSHPASSIILLVLAIICSVGVSLSLEKLIESYDDRCILHADVHFETELERANYFQKFSNSMRRAVDVIEDNSVKAEKSLGKLSDHFNESYASFLNSDLNAEYPVDQIRFLVESKIGFVCKNSEIIDYSIQQMKSTIGIPFGDLNLRVTLAFTFRYAKRALA